MRSAELGALEATRERILLKRVVNKTEQCSLLKEGKHIRKVISRKVWSLIWYPYIYFCPSVHPPIY